MSDLTKLERYMQLVDRLVRLADKEELAECARLMALNIAHYETIYGELPLQDRVAMTHATDLNDQQNELVTKGMETMAGVLGSVIQGLDEKTEH